MNEVSFFRILFAESDRRYAFLAAWVIGHGGLRKKEIEAIAAATVKVNNNPSDILVDDVRDYRIVLVKGIVGLSNGAPVIHVLLALGPFKEPPWRFRKP